MKRLLLLFTLILAGACTGSKFEQIEYYKSPDNFRVFVYVTPTATIEEIKTHANSQMWTERKSPRFCTTVQIHLEQELQELLPWQNPSRRHTKKRSCRAAYSAAR